MKLLNAMRVIRKKLRRRAAVRFTCHSRAIIGPGEADWLTSWPWGDEEWTEERWKTYIAECEAQNQAAGTVLSGSRHQFHRPVNWPTTPA